MKWSFALFATCAIFTGGASAASVVDKPNVVYVMADDLGWGDLGVNGGDIPTPTLDKLFEDGVRLDNFMGWCVCSPTRATRDGSNLPFRVELYDVRKDIGETTNVADTHPEVVAALQEKMNAWVDSMGVALSHLPPPQALHSNPAPEGEVLEITVTVTDRAKPADSLLVQFARWDGRVYATDFVEYDLALAPGSPRKGFYYTPFKGNNGQTTPYFKRGEGVDQFGREQISGPEPEGGAGVWEHRIIGLASYGPGIAPGHGVMFKGGRPGTYKVFIDNLRIRHADGRTTPIWSSGKDIRAVKFQETESFKDLRIRPVSADDVGR